MSRAYLQPLYIVGFLGLAACSAQELPKNNPFDPEPVYLERQYQRVIRYNCLRDVISDKEETVGSPTKWVEIRPGYLGLVHRSSFRNQRTGSSAGLMSGLYKFKIDYEKGAFNMHVRAGVNPIEFRFYTCNEYAWDGDGQHCVRESLVEQGVSYIDVRYSSVHLSTPMEVSECP
jgi:hypothetical protein